MRTWTDFIDGCPRCKSADITLVETEVFGFEYTESYVCGDCGFKWDDVFKYNRSYEKDEA